MDLRLLLELIEPELEPCVLNRSDRVSIESRTLPQELDELPCAETSGLGDGVVGAGGSASASPSDLAAFARAAAMATYGHVSTWETGAVTDMSYLFCAAHERFGACSPAAEAFNDDIGAWDTSRVTDVSYMFAGSPTFNQDLGAWAVDGVTDLRGMFDGAAAFDQDLGWCVAGDAAQDGAFAASACAAAACGTSKGTRLYAKDCGGGDDGCGGDLLVGDGHCGGDWQCAGDLRCGIGNCGDFRGGADWDPSESGAHWDLADDCCYEPGVVHAAPEALRVVCPAPPEKSEGRKDADDDHATAITAGVVLGLVLLAFCASQRRRLRKPEPPRAADPEAGKAEPTHDLQRENDALRETIQRLHDDLAKATAGVGGVVVALEAGARTEASTDDLTRENEALQATIQRLNDQLERATAPEGVEFLDVGTNTDTGRPRGPRARVRRVEFEFRVGVGRGDRLLQGRLRRAPGGHHATLLAGLPRQDDPGRDGSRPRRRGRRRPERVAADAAEVGRTPAPPRIQKIEEGPAPEAAERGKGTGSGTAGPGPLLRRRRHGTPGPHGRNVQP